MKGMIFQNGAEPRELLQGVIDQQIPAIMSYLSRGKWHVAKIQFVSLGANKVNVQVQRDQRPHPVNIALNQPVGVSLKCRFGKVVFDTSVIGFEACSNSAGGQIVLAIPCKVETVQRRAYFRVTVPKSMKVNATLWHRHQNVNGQRKAPDKYWQCRLVDISAGGLQLAIDNSTGPDFHKGQFVTMQFTPLPYERPIIFSAQIRNILPTADTSRTCLGLQIVGLEASPEGRETLQRLCDIVERYYQMNQTPSKQQHVEVS